MQRMIVTQKCREVGAHKLGLLAAAMHRTYFKRYPSSHAQKKKPCNKTPEMPTCSNSPPGVMSSKLRPPSVEWYTCAPIAGGRSPAVTSTSPCAPGFKACHPNSNSSQASTSRSCKHLQAPASIQRSQACYARVTVPMSPCALD